VTPLDLHPFECWEPGDRLCWCPRVCWIVTHCPEVDWAGYLSCSVDAGAISDLGRADAGADP
jgi:hypothetical protein